MRKTTRQMKPGQWKFMRDILEWKRRELARELEDRTNPNWKNLIRITIEGIDELITDLEAQE